ncbi:O-antigen ligase family protein [Patescibacteria group bacterium]
MKLSKQTTATIFVTILIGIFTLLFFWINPPIYLYLLFFAIAFLFIARYPLSGLLAAIFLTLVFGQQFALQPLVTETGNYLLYPLDILLILTALAAVLQRRKWWPKAKKEWRWLTPLINIFIIVITANMLWSFYAGTDTILALSAFKNYAVYGLLFFLGVVLLRSWKDISKLLRTILMSGLAAGIILLINLVRGVGFLVEYNPITTSGTRYLAGIHAWALVLALIISLAYLAYRMKVWRHFQIPIVLGQIVGLGISLFRHLWLVIAFIGATLIAWMPLDIKRRFINFAGRFLVLIAIGGLFTFYISAFIPNWNLNLATEDYLQPFVERVTTINLNPEEESAQFRLKSWESAWNAFLENPILGNGLDAKLGIEINDFKQTIEARDVHNSFLTILVETGLIGLLPLLALIILLLTRGRRALKQATKHQGTIMALLLCLIAFVLGANFGVYFETNMTGIFFWILAAGLFAAVQLSDKAPAESQANEQSSQ